MESWNSLRNSLRNTAFPKEYSILLILQGANTSRELNARKLTWALAAECPKLGPCVWVQRVGDEGPC